MAVFEPTAEQKQIFMHRAGLAKIYAGPGTGKTSTLLHYIGQIQADLSGPLLVLCFNSVVRKELMQRLTAMGITQVQVHTFHSLAFKELKLKVTDKNLELQQRLLLKQALLQTRQNKIITQQELDEFESFVTAQKAVYPIALPLHSLHKMPYEQFEQLRKAKDLAFYDDWLQLYASKLTMHGAPTFAAVLIDEAQDLNPIQFTLFEYLTTHAKIAMMVGDVDQTLYQWRQAEPSKLLHFTLAHLPAADYTLSTTFRYGHEQALVAQQLIHQNLLRHPLLTISTGEQQTEFALQQEDAPVFALVSKICDLQKQQPNATFAVIAPNWAALEPVQMAMMIKNMAYYIKPGKRLKMHDSYLLLGAINQLCHADYDAQPYTQKQQSIETILTTPSFAVKHDEIKTLAANFAHLPMPLFLEHLHQIHHVARPALANALHNLIIVLAMRTTEQKTAAAQLSEYYKSTKLIDSIQADLALSEDSRNEKCFHYLQLLSLAEKKNQSLTKFHHFIQGLMTLAAKAASNPNIILGTVHFHKGLEYDYVCTLVGESWGKDKHILTEEERRSLYVAITRARKGTYIFADKEAEVAAQLQLEQAKQAYHSLVSKEIISKVAGTCANYVKKCLGLADKQTAKA
ncbi:MAG: ATP-dependent helicase [Paraglaciecola sp.]|nr:ATP-dependent helicase [Paraglaciecola sp.]